MYTRRTQPQKPHISVLYQEDIFTAIKSARFLKVLEATLKQRNGVLWEATRTNANYTLKYNNTKITESTFTEVKQQ